MASIFDLFSSGSGERAAGRAASAQQQATQKAIEAQKAQQQSAVNALMTGQTGATQAFTAGMDPYRNLGTESAGFLPLYAGAVGAGGDPNAANAAFQQFWQSTGSQSDLERALEGISRVEAGTGQTGQSNMDAIKYAEDLNKQAYQNWLNDVFRGVGEQNVAAQGIQQGYGQIGAGELGTAGRIAGQYDIFNPANLYQRQGDITAQELAQKYAAGQTAGANTLNALFGLGNLAVGAGAAYNQPSYNPLAGYAYDPTWSNTTTSVG